VGAVGGNGISLAGAVSCSRYWHMLHVVVKGVPTLRGRVLLLRVRGTELLGDTMLLLRVIAVGWGWRMRSMHSAGGVSRRIGCRSN